MKEKSTHSEGKGAGLWASVQFFIPFYGLSPVGRLHTRKRSDYINTQYSLTPTETLRCCKINIHNIRVKQLAEGKRIIAFSKHERPNHLFRILEGGKIKFDSKVHNAMLFVCFNIT